MKNYKNKILAFIAVLSLMMITTTNFAIADGMTVGDAAKAFTEPLRNIDKVFMVFAYVAGLILVIIGALKLKEHTDSRGQVKILSAILYIAGGALLIAAPTYFLMGREILGIQDSSFNPDSDTFRY